MESSRISSINRLLFQSFYTFPEYEIDFLINIYIYIYIYICNFIISHLFMSVYYCTAIDIENAICFRSLFYFYNI